jgi:hypothetical protein
MRIEFAIFIGKTTTCPKGVLLQARNRGCAEIKFTRARHRKGRIPSLHSLGPMQLSHHR